MDAKQLAQSWMVEYVQYVREKNFTDLANMFTPDAKLMAPGHPTFVGREEIKKSTEKKYAITTDVKIFQDEILQLGDDTILERSRYKKMCGEIVMDEGKFIVVYKKIDGNLRAFMGMFNSDICETEKRENGN